MSSVKDESTIYFDGSNWQDLQRLVTTSRMKFLQTSTIDPDPYEDEPAKCAYLISHLQGAALDWAGSQFDANPATINHFSNFVQNLRNAFGVSDEGLAAQRRGQLEGLKWQSDLPVFFAEFDRLTALLGINDDASKIAMVRSKLPLNVQTLLAEQALNFAHYGTMRERLLTMWNLDPRRTTAVTSGAPSGSRGKRPRCGRCGRKGHT